MGTRGTRLWAFNAAPSMDMDGAVSIHIFECIIDRCSCRAYNFEKNQMKITK